MRPKNADSLLVRVREYCLSKDWVTPLEICNALSLDRARIGSVASRLRDLATEKFGNYNKEVKWVNGIMEYRIRPFITGQQNLFKGEVNENHECK